MGRFPRNRKRYCPNCHKKKVDVEDMSKKAITWVCKHCGYTYQQDTKDLLLGAVVGAGMIIKDEILDKFDPLGIIH